MKIQWKKLLLCIVVPLAVGGLSALLTRNGTALFQTLSKPSFSPPGWLFPVVWTILYILMGIAVYLVLVSKKTDRGALTFYGIQLFFNFFWPVLFFNMELYLFAFIWLVVLWILIFVTSLLFHNVSKVSGYLMLPYLLWTAFAGYLNFSIYLLN